MDDSPREACGVFGVFAPGEDVARLTFYGLYSLQHRGQESAGIATTDGRKLQVRTGMGLVSQVFDDFRYVREIGAPDSSDHALVFTARVGDKRIEGCDFLHRDEHGTIDAELEVIGDLGTGRIRLLDEPLSFWSAELTTRPETGLWPKVGGAVAGALREEVAHFIARVRDGTPETIASVADAISGLRLAEAIVQSAASRTVVTLDVQT